MRVPSMRVRPWYAALLAVAVWTGVSAQVRDAIRAGDPPRQQKIAEGQTHTFEISLVARDILRVRVDQGAVNLAVVVRGPDRQELANANNSATQDTEFISILAPVNGLYSIDVVAASPG